MTVYGSNFDTRATVQVLRGSTVIRTGVTRYNSSTRLSADLRLGSVYAGDYDICVKNSNNLTSNTLTFTLTR